jgi:hypothetical protein
MIVLAIALVLSLVQIVAFGTQLAPARRDRS